jgi:hypothetical protein
MSSRALRRAQRELEEKQIQEKLAQEEQEDEQEDSEEEVLPKSKSKPSLFAMLGDDGDDQEEDEDEDAEQEQPEPEKKPGVDTAPQSKSKKSMKKKKKGKSKAAALASATDAAGDNASFGLDEIDQALLALDLSANGQTNEDSNLNAAAISDEVKQLCDVLRVDKQYLHAANEMKKLFGRAALQDNDDEARPRQRGNAQQGGIAGAVAGRNGPGRNLASLGLRRNIFIQGKEEWPRATSGGLGMEIAEKRLDGTVEYRFMHSRSYQEVQQQFQVCVGSMDPERMIQLLHFNRECNRELLPFSILTEY